MMFQAPLKSKSKTMAANHASEQLLAGGGFWVSGVCWAPDCRMPSFLQYLSAFVCRTADAAVEFVFSHVQLARRAHDDPVQLCMFEPGGFTLKSRGALRRGRPRQWWGESVYKAALSIAGSLEGLTSLLAPTSHAERAWGATVRQHCHNLA